MKKDKEWLKDRLKNEQYYTESKELKGTEKMPFGELYGRGVRGGIGKALELVEELDEPKVKLKDIIARLNELNKNDRLSWIRSIAKTFKVEISESEYSSGYDQGKVDGVAELQEEYTLLKKPVIPKFVADWIEEKLPKSSVGTNTIENKIYIISRLGYGNGLNTDVLYQGRDYEFNNKLNRDLVEYVSNNKVKVIRALINGYEVQEEQKYHVVNKENYFMLRKYDGLVDILRTSPSMSRDKYGKDTRFMLTEKEIKDYDERYWAFAVEVTE